VSAIKRKRPQPKFSFGQEVRLRGDEAFYTIAGIDKAEAELPSYHLADASGGVVLSVAIKNQRLLRRADAKPPRQRHPGYRIEKIEHAVEIALTLRQSWFRGHTRQHRTLVPGIFRPHYNETYRALVPDYEASIYRSFRRRAPAILERIPPPEDDEGWLFVMQHHGSPTRLLDWTENALAALYFAVSGDFGHTGELWALYPPALNALSGIDDFPQPGHPVRRFLAGSPQHSEPQTLTALGIDSLPIDPIAIAPTLTFPRMVAQRSVFTIHPPPQKGHTIDALLSSKKQLVRYTIPADSKGHLLHDLRLLGVTRATLFPDLDSLSSSIVDEHNWVGYGIPDPPKW